MRILVVEDEVSLAEAVAEVLRDEAYAVDLAACGTAAGELMAVNDYDLVEMDRSGHVVRVAYRLRRKIDGGREHKLLHTLKGVGYMLRDQRA